MLTSSKNTKWTQSSLTLTFGRGVSLLLLSITLGGACSSLKARTNVVSVSTTEIVTATLILEAGGEANDHGMVAVYEVIQNRARMSKKTLSQICLAPKQFSCWNGVSDVAKIIEKAKKHKKWYQARHVVLNAVNANYTKGATHYHSNKISPPFWIRKMTCVGEIGNHTFYK